MLQVAAGVYAGFMWACKKPKAGCNFPDHTDTDFILKTVSICEETLGNAVLGTLHIDGRGPEQHVDQGLPQAAKLPD